MEKLEAHVEITSRLNEKGVLVIFMAQMVLLLIKKHIIAGSLDFQENK